MDNFGDSNKLVTNCVPSAGRVPRSRLWLGASSSLSFAAVALHFSLPSRDQRNSGYLQDRKKFGRFAEVNEENVPILAISSILQERHGNKTGSFQSQTKIKQKQHETTKDKSTSQTCHFRMHVYCIHPIRYLLKDTVFGQRFC